MLRRMRDLELRRAARIVVPRRHSRTSSRGWGFAADVIPHAVSAPALPEVARRRSSSSPGRLVPQKALSVAFEAVRRNPDVTLDGRR